MELNHRSQACEVLAVTGFRVAKRNLNRTESGTRLDGRAQAPSTVRGFCQQAGFTWENGRA
jgi:hypothetical protein